MRKLPSWYRRRVPELRSQEGVSSPRGRKSTSGMGHVGGALRISEEGVRGGGAGKTLPEEQRKFGLKNAWPLVGKPWDVNGRLVTCADLGGFKGPVLLMTGDKSPPQYKPIFDAF